MKEREKCYFCHGGPVVSKKVNVHRYVKGHLVEIKDVPCDVCEQCGEKYFDAQTIRHLENIVKQKAREYIEVPVYEYA
jgi:YgiT-type zinc finger domain-containing protein